MHRVTSRWAAGVAAVLLACVASAQAPQPAPAPAPAAIRLTLPEALQRVLAQHPDVMSAQAAIVEARAQAKIAEAQRWPTVNLEAAATETKNLGSSTAKGVARGSTDLSLALNYDIFNSTREYTIRRAEVQAEAQQYGLPDTQRQLAFEVMSAYYDILAARQLTKALLQSVAASERHREMVEARITAGTAPQSDLLPVLVEVSQARLAAVQAETSLETAQATLRALLAVPAGTALDLDPTMPAANYASELPQLLETARNSRPDVKQQELTIQAARLTTDVARAQNNVQFSGTATADYGAHSDVTGDAWQVQVAATVPIFNGGALKAGVTSARAAEEIQRQRLASLLLQVQQQVETAHSQAKQAVVALETATVARQNAENSLRAAEARYAEGLAIIVEVTDAQVQLLQSQVAEVQARLNFAAALAALDQATGVLPVSGPVAPGQ